MFMLLFDIRSDDSHAGFIQAVNRSLDAEPGHVYLSQHGYLCSPMWWMQFDQRDFPIKTKFGQITWVGPRLAGFNEEEDVIEFLSKDGVIGYDRVGCWMDHPIRVGDQLSITPVNVELHFPGGVSTWIVDVQGEWTPSVVTSPSE